jgi:hypothetical protein
MARTIQSPGVEIKEVDLSLRPAIATGTTVLAAGFADRGPTDEVIQVTSLSEFEQIYGLPQTPAERYFYHSVRPLFNSPANVLTYRLPYGSNTGVGFGNDYGALVYPCSAIVLSGTIGEETAASVNTFEQQLSGTEPNQVPVPTIYVLGKPIHFQLSQQEYFSIKQREGFAWDNTIKSRDNITRFNDLGNAGVIILNKGQTSINRRFEGFYIGVADNSNFNEATNFDSIISAQTVTASAFRTDAYVSLPESRLNFALSGQGGQDGFTSDSGSVSEIMENLTQYDISRHTFDDTLVVGLFKLRQSIFASDVIKLDFVLSESYVGSVDFNRQQQSQTGGAPRSFFVGTVEDSSPNIEILVNDFLARKNDNTWLGLDGKPINKIRMASSKFTGVSAVANWRALSSSYIPADLSATGPSLSALLSDAAKNPADSLFTVGAYSGSDASTKKLGNISSKINRLLDTVDNPDIFDIDITIEAGLGTINAGKDGDDYDDLADIPAISGFAVADITKISSDAETYRSNWKAVYDKFNDFAEKQRKDHLFIADLPRPIFVKGANFKTLQDPDKNFSLYISKPVQAFTSILNSSYSTTYACWSKVFDAALDEQVWVPFSGTAAEIMANTDSNFQPWFAPAGFTRGRVGGINDIVFYPKQKQRDQFYKNSVNPVAFFPGDGFVIFGQKTLQSTPTAFDRINVRRLFLNLEKSTRATMKYFIFEPNTLLTRTRVVNTLTPIFENAKNTEGLFDYLIVCDERNNTPEIIDQNELIVDIYLKPVRAAEFILVNFYATRTGTDFNEIVG